jgi:hypothetical protein
MLIVYQNLHGRGHLKRIPSELLAKSCRNGCPTDDCPGVWIQRINISGWFLKIRH